MPMPMRMAMSMSMMTLRTAMSTTMAIRTAMSGSVYADDDNGSYCSVGSSGNSDCYWW